MIGHENRAFFIDILQQMVFMKHERLAKKVFNDAVST